MHPSANENAESHPEVEDELLDLGADIQIPDAGVGLEPHPMAASSEEPQRDRVVILGRTRAGKTIYLSRLYEHCWKGDGPLRMEAHDGRTHLSLLAAVEQMREQRKWPAATESSNYLDLQITWNGFTLTMVSLDYPGEVFHRAFVDQVQDQDTRELVEHVRRAAAVLLLIDPKVLATGRMGEAADDDFGMVQALRFLRSLPGGNRVPIALVVTKIDENEDLLRQHGKLRGFAERYCANLLRIVPGLRLFGTCAVRGRMDASGHAVPDISRKPRGLTGPVEYCMRRIVSERIANERDRAARAIRERVLRAERQAEADDRRENRIWLAINVALLTGVALAGLVAWLVVKNFG